MCSPRLHYCSRGHWIKLLGDGCACSEICKYPQEEVQVNTINSNIIEPQLRCLLCRVHSDTMEMCEKIRAGQTIRVLHPNGDGFHDPTFQSCETFTIGFYNSADELVSIKRIWRPHCRTYMLTTLEGTRPNVYADYIKSFPEAWTKIPYPSDFFGDITELLGPYIDPLYEQYAPEAYPGITDQEIRDREANMYRQALVDIACFGRCRYSRPPLIVSARTLRLFVLADRDERTYAICRASMLNGNTPACLSDSDLLDELDEEIVNGSTIEDISRRILAIALEPRFQHLFTGHQMTFLDKVRRGDVRLDRIRNFEERLWERVDRLPDDSEATKTMQGNWKILGKYKTTGDEAVMQLIHPYVLDPPLPPGF